MVNTFRSSFPPVPTRVGEAGTVPAATFSAAGATRGLTPGASLPGVGAAAVPASMPGAAVSAARVAPSRWFELLVAWGTALCERILSYRQLNLHRRGFRLHKVARWVGVLTRGGSTC